MYTHCRPSHSATLFLAALVSALLLMPVACGAQTTFFGSGGTTNTAANTYNVALGYGALYFNTTGFLNTAIGTNALSANTTGNYNTANGYEALCFNFTGNDNTANGYQALYTNTTGSFNTANGYDALFNNTTGYNNTANGVNALLDNTTGFYNTANGYKALNNNTNGYDNTANGYDALLSNTHGDYNTAEGVVALHSNTTGNDNVAIGYQALLNNLTGSNNLGIGVGAGSLTTGSNNIEIGNAGVASESEAIRIGTSQTATYIAGINGVTASGGVAVYIDANGQLGTLTSSRRFKRDIHTMGSVSERLMQLRPVTFRYKDTAEKGAHALQYGLIAEEVAKVYPDLVQYDKAGKPYTIYYHLLTPMLLNELQKEHRQNVAMKSAVIKQNARITVLTAAHNTDKAEITSLKSELAALKQSQQQQIIALGKLTALMETSQGKTQLHSAAYTQH